MHEFVLDRGSVKSSKQFAALDSFTQGYIEAAFWTECHADNPELDDASLDDLAPETLEAMLQDCMDFQAFANDDLESYYAAGRDEAHAGHDFWLTRNGHGAGFWDRGLGAAGDKLSEFARTYGGSDLYRGDDGLIYVS